jgi:hypothetical protein
MNNKEKGVNELVVEFVYSEWLHFIDNFSSGKDRKRLKIGFTNALSEQLQTKGVKCWLTCKYNWIKDLNAQSKSQIWSGKYKCLDNSCEVVYDCVAKRDKDIVRSTVKVTGLVKHVKIRKSKRYAGQERKSLANNILRSGTCAVLEESLIYNTENELEIDKFESLRRCDDSIILRKIKHEAKRDKLISREIAVDSEAAKKLCDLFCESNHSMRGFVQLIGQNPYCLLLMSLIQVF